jgi:uncharacterized repeat protein (TIGR03806 family)
MQMTKLKGILIVLISLVLLGIYSCTTDRSTFVDDFDIDTDGDGVADSQEVLNGTNKNDPCDPVQNSDHTLYDALNILWSVADCDNDGVNNSDEVANNTNPFINESLDTDGDGVLDYLEIQNGTDKDNPCSPFQSPGYAGYNSLNSIWSISDCDRDGINNGYEIANDSDPYFDEIGGMDTDGDGIKDEREMLDGTDLNDPCDPVQDAGYEGYDVVNTVWSVADCDKDGINNGSEITGGTDPYLDNTIYVVPEFLPKLSELRLFTDDLSNLELNSTVYEYSVSTSLFADYAHKLRSVALPKGGQMVYNGEGLLSFPDNTLISETFYYPNDERNPAMGKRIIETRILIKINGIWDVGNYIWNDGQTEAFLNDGTQIVQVDWIDNQGNDRAVDYKVIHKNLCIQCHNSNGNTIPIGIKSRALNFEYKGTNQIQYFVDNGLLVGAPDVSQIAVLPDWSDASLLIDERARAYLDINCAHCHQPGGSYNTSFGNSFDFRFETSYENSNIYEKRVEIQNRMNAQIPGYFMPLIGTTVIHTEGVELINAYIDSLE